MIQIPETRALALRMRSLLLAGEPGGSAGPALIPDGTGPAPAAVAEWFGAMQAQDLESGLWSFGVRSAGLRRADVQGAVADREVLRTWTQRGTIHFVSARDARWILELCAPRALAQAAGRRRGLGLDERVIELAMAALEAALRGNNRLTRVDALESMGAAGVDVAGQRGIHLLRHAGQLGLICMGPGSGREQTYVLLDEWAPDSRRYDREQSLAELAIRYFRSHGPTTRQNFAGWSGLTARDAGLGIDLAGDSLVKAELLGQQVWLTADVLEQADAAPSAESGAVPVRVLPGFDEFVLGFKDRGLQVPDGFSERIVPGGNGVFRATVVVAGRVAGTWSKAQRSKHLVVEVDLFEGQPAGTRSAIEAEFAGYSRYLDLPVEVRWTS